MEMTLFKRVRETPEIREGFFRLAERVFGLSFREWHAAGFWSERYLPYALGIQGRVVANVSVNTLDFCWQDAPRRYIQLGTVMTDPEYRGQGLARRLMQAVLADWAERCDALYLFANDSVLDFYPKFGFVPAQEYGYTLPVSPQAAARRPLDMGDAADLALLKRYYQCGNPYSAFPFLHNFELLMFYCGGPMRGCVYLLPELDAVAILQQDGEVLHCLDIYGAGSAPLQQVLDAAATPPVHTVHLGFTPKEAGNAAPHPRKEEDETLFLLSGKENLFAQNRLMFPLLSHA